MKKKISTTANENFQHFQAFFKASFILLSTKKRYKEVIFYKAHDPFEIRHDPSV